MSGLESLLTSMGTTATGTAMGAGAGAAGASAAGAAASPAAMQAATLPARGLLNAGLGVGSNMLVGQALGPPLSGGGGGAGAAGAGAAPAAPGAAAPAAGGGFDAGRFAQQLGGLAGQLAQGGGGRMPLPGPMPGGVGGAQFQIADPFRSQRGPQSGRGLLDEYAQFRRGVL